MAHNYGLLETNNGLLWGIVACNFWLLGVPGRLLKHVPEKIMAFRHFSCGLKAIILHTLEVQARLQLEGQGRKIDVDMYHPEGPGTQYLIGLWP